MKHATNMTKHGFVGGIFAALGFLICPPQAIADGAVAACKIRPALALVRPELHGDDPILIRFEVTNEGEAICKLPADLLPEGWLITLIIQDSQGRLVYRSPGTKLEMTLAKLQDLTLLKPSQTHAAEIKLSPMQAGAYVLKGTFSTRALQNRKLQDVPIGSWETEPLAFKVSPN